MRIRAARPDEYAEVAALTLAGFDHARTPTPERLALLRDAAGRARDGELLVAQDAGGALVGTASLLRAGTASARLAVAGEAELRLLAVLPDRRGRGIAHALMRAAIDIARGWPVDSLVLDTGSANVTAQRLYHRLGFTRVPSRETRLGSSGAPLAVFELGLGPTTGVRVRLAAPAEYDRVGELTVAAYELDYALSDNYRADLRNVGSLAHDQELWVAEDATTGRLLGSVVTPRPGAQLSELARDGELGFRMLAVDPTARRTGLGRVLVDHVIALARLRGAHRVVMNSGPQMLGAHRLYERLGFVRLTERETYVLPDGRTLLAFGLDLQSLLEDAR